MTRQGPFFIRALLLTGALACADSDVTPLGAPEIVLSEIRLGGADRVAERVATDVRFGQTLMDGIASGDSLWLEVARALPLKSAAVEASFAIALAGALPREPERVLKLAGTKTQVERVCGIPFLDSTAEGIDAYYDSAVAALSRTATRAPLLASTAEQCGLALDSARSRKLARIDPAYVVKNKPPPPRPVPQSRRRR